jgi:hypothetical protein
VGLDPFFGEGFDFSGRSIGEEGLVLNDVIPEAVPELLFWLDIRCVRDVAGIIILDILEAGVPHILLKDFDRAGEV